MPSTFLEAEGSYWVHTKATFQLAQKYKYVNTLRESLTNGNKSQQTIVPFFSPSGENFWCAFSTDHQKELIECVVIYAKYNKHLQIFLSLQ